MVIELNAIWLTPPITTPPISCLYVFSITLRQLARLGGNGRRSEHPFRAFGTHKGNMGGEKKTRDKGMKHFENLEKNHSMARLYILYQLSGDYDFIRTIEVAAIDQRSYLHSYR